MQLAKIYSSIDLRKTLINIPVGVEACIPRRTFPTEAIRKKASQLKKQGYLCVVSSPQETDLTFVRREK